jgi:hypothetical protein
MAQALRVLEELKKNEVTHVIGLPDNSSVKPKLLRLPPAYGSAARSRWF